MPSVTATAAVNDASPRPSTGKAPRARPTAGCPAVVLISGFTHPTNEFTTPYRVINWHACNSCWNDPKLRFDHHDFLWCPRHQGTPRHFECTRLITPDHVTRVTRTVAGFREQHNAAGLTSERSLA